MSTASSSYKSSNSPLNFPFTTNNDTNNRMGDYSVINPTGAVESIFKNSRFVPFPLGPDNNGFPTGAETNVHNDDIYDTSILSLIDYTQSDKLKGMRLTTAHFAYLKNLGVFPNNRLLIARRFPSAVGNDLTTVKVEPMATLISWVANDADFMDISFGERWVDAAGSFEDVLNGVGKDSALSEDNKAGMGDLGKNLYAAHGIVPLPGLMEGLQQKILKELGITDNDPTILPDGNPNLIREARRRYTLERGKADSGLKCDFEIKMVVEYEQKYLNSNDSTPAYFDLIANVLSFATSDAQFMYNQAYAKGANGILGNLINGEIGAVMATISKFVEKFIGVLADQASKIAKTLFANKAEKKTNPANTDAVPSESAIKDLIKLTLGAVIGKYKMAILGVISALTGVPSTPWHITIGNPKRPYFSSGDMYMDNVNMVMGPVLSWNDLPSSITVEFTLKNARNLGAQEIMNRFNSGRTRSYIRNVQDIFSTQGETPLNSSQKKEVDTPFGKGLLGSNTLPGNGSSTPII